MTTLVGGEAAPRRRKRGDDVRWADTILLVQKMKKIHVIDSTYINGR
jgi:hypothetical protein